MMQTIKSMTGKNRITWTIGTDHGFGGQSGPDHVFSDNRDNRRDNRGQTTFFAQRARIRMIENRGMLPPYLCNLCVPVG
jgi:hypothetical protein